MPGRALGGLSIRPEPCITAPGTRIRDLALVPLVPRARASCPGLRSGAWHHGFRLASSGDLKHVGASAEGFSEDNLAKARAVIAAIFSGLVQPKFVQDAAFADELHKLGMMASVESCTVPLKEIMDMKAAYLANGNLKMQQALAKFPTGRALCDAIDLEHTASLQDAKSLKTLQSAEATCNQLLTGAERFSEKNGVARFKDDHAKRLSREISGLAQLPWSLRVSARTWPKPS